MLTPDRCTLKVKKLRHIFNHCSRRWFRCRV